MLRLDETTTQKLQQLVEQFGLSRAEIIRQLIAQAKLEDFQRAGSWRQRGATDDGLHRRTARG
jgi:predicted transcriptional regulator